MDGLRPLIQVNAKAEAPLRAQLLLWHAPAHHVQLSLFPRPIFYKACGLSICTHLQTLMPVLEAYCTCADVETRELALLALAETIRQAKPRMLLPQRQQVCALALWMSLQIRPRFLAGPAVSQAPFPSLPLVAPGIAEKSVTERGAGAR